MITATLPDGSKKTLSASEWELHPDVTVTRTTIARRLKLGATPEEALGFVTKKKAKTLGKDVAYRAFILRKMPR